MAMRAPAAISTLVGGNTTLQVSRTLTEEIAAVSKARRMEPLRGLYSVVCNSDLFHMRTSESPKRHSPLRLSAKLTSSIRLPLLRVQRSHIPHPSLLPILQATADSRKTSVCSDVSNHFLIETRRNRDIDESIRLNIELKFRESTVNQTYVFPRTHADTEPKPIADAGKAEESTKERLKKHTVTRSYDGGAGVGLRSAMGPMKDIVFVGKEIRLRPSIKVRKRQESSESRSLTRSKSPYTATSISPIRSVSRTSSSNAKLKPEQRHRHQQSLRGLQHRVTPYGTESFRVIDRVNTLK